MSKKFVLGTAICMLLSPTIVGATPTHWEFQGRFTSVSGSEAPAGVAPGTPFRIVVGFDTAATLGSTQAGSESGFRYNYSSPMRWQIYAGAECNPCDVSFPSGNIILRDNFSSAPGVPAVDGYSFGGIDDDTDLSLTMRGTTTDIVNGPGLAVEPDPRLADLEIAGLEVCGPFNPYTCARIALTGEIDAVIRPTYGTGYLFTARDCRIPNVNPGDSLPYDCVNGGRFVNGAFVSSARQQRWQAPNGGNNGGGVGAGSYSGTHTPVASDVDLSWEDGQSWHTILMGQLGLDPTASLGSMYGEISFGGPLALPLIRGNSFPSDVSRTNSNLYAYQKYNYSGGVTQLPLIMDLTYEIEDNSNDPSVNPNFVSERPGGAVLSAALAIVDSSIALEELQRISGTTGFNALTCGSEQALGLPPGTILGAATVRSTEGQKGPQAVALTIESCANPGQQVQLAANQDFYVTAALQVPARGKAPQPPSANTSVTANGFVDSANTLRIAIDPAASPALVAQLAANIEPACGENCGESFEPEPLDVRIDLKPGSSDNCVNVGLKGVIPVAVLGSSTLGVQQVRTDGTLRLGTLPVQTHKGRSQCSIGEVNGDAYPDLVCHFVNSRSNWQAGQNTVTLTGQLASGVAIEASDSVCLKP